MKLGLFDPNSSASRHGQQKDHNDHRIAKSPRQQHTSGKGTHRDRTRMASRTSSPRRQPSPLTPLLTPEAQSTPLSCLSSTSSIASESSSYDNIKMDEAVPTTSSSQQLSNVFLPRHVVRHCKVISRQMSRNNGHTGNSNTSRNGKSNRHASSSSNAASNGKHNSPTRQPPYYGICTISASINHSAALVKQPCGSNELYTCGKGDEGALLLNHPDYAFKFLEESELNLGSKKTPQASALALPPFMPLPPSPRRWETVSSSSSSGKQKAMMSQSKGPEAFIPKNSASPQAAPANPVTMTTRSITIKKS